MIRKFINYFKKDKQEDTTEIIKKDFNVEEFNDWFNNEYDGYDGRKGNKGIFLRLDKLSPYMIEDYLKYIGQETTDNNIYKYNSIIRKDWLEKINK